MGDTGRISSKIERVREWLWYGIQHGVQKNPKRAFHCWVCGTPVTKTHPDGTPDIADMLTGCCDDDALIHHINGNRNENEVSNLAACHRDCHRQWHTDYEQLGQDNRKSEAIMIWGKTPSNYCYKDGPDGKFHNLDVKRVEGVMYADQNELLRRKIALLEAKRIGNKNE